MIILTVRSPLVSQVTCVSEAAKSLPVPSLHTIVGFTSGVGAVQQPVTLTEIGLCLFRMRTRPVFFFFFLFSFFFPPFKQQDGGCKYQKNAWTLTLPLEICHQESVLDIFLFLPVVYLSQCGDHFKVSVIELRTHICYIFKKTKLVFEILFLVLCLGTLSLSIEADRSDDSQCCFLSCSFCLPCVALLCFPEFYSFNIIILYHM